MPLASPPDRPEVVYGFGRSDASGRVADRATMTALGWRGGDRLTLTADAGMMMARRDRGGMVTVPARPYIVIPAALRRRCRLRAGDQVLLAHTHSRWWTKRCGRAPRPLEKGGGHGRHTPGRLSQQAVVEATLVLLKRMSLTPADLAAIPHNRLPVPAFAEYIPIVSAAVSAGTRRAYGSCWNRVVEHWGGRRQGTKVPNPPAGGPGGRDPGAGGPGGRTRR